MKQLLKKLWNDQGGFILSTEAMILWTIVVLGMVVGLVAVRDASVNELTEVGNAIMSFDQSFQYGSVESYKGLLHQIILVLLEATPMLPSPMGQCSRSSGCDSLTSVDAYGIGKQIAENAANKISIATP